MIVIPCHCITKPYVVECVQSIRQHMPAVRILVVDTHSPDKSYLPAVKALGAEVDELPENVWDWGAFWYAYHAYPDEPFFYWLHDSTLVRQDLSWAEQRPLTILAALKQWEGCMPNHIPCTLRLLAQTDYPMPDTFSGVFASMMFCERAVLDRLVAHGLDRIRVTTRIEGESCERVLGIGLGLEGYDLPALAFTVRSRLCDPHSDAPVHKIHGKRFAPPLDPDQDRLSRAVALFGWTHGLGCCGSCGKPFGLEFTANARWIVTSSGVQWTFYCADHPMPES